MNHIIITTIFSEVIIFLSYAAICAGMIELRFSKKTCLFAAGGIFALIAMIQAALFLSGQDVMFLLTMLPITAYLPAAAGLYVLSRYNFQQTTAALAVGILSAFTLKILNTILFWYFGSRIRGLRMELWMAIAELSAAALLVFLFFRFLYKPFHVYVKEIRTNWLSIFFPILMIVILFSYFKNSSIDFTVWFLLFLTALSLLLAIAKLLASSAAVARMKETEKAVEFRMQMQRREYEDICKKIEAGRIYRHDMRHHLSALEELAKQGEMENILGYLKNMRGRLSQTERKVYCENIAVNAVLSSAIGRAKDADCDVFARVDIPEEIPYDAIDICMALANAIENAVNACQKINEKEKRYIRVLVRFQEQRNLLISVENSCEEDISFDKDGYPDVPVEKGHGVGLKSIHAVTEKYNGFLKCECSGGEFRLHAALFCARTLHLPDSRKQESFWKKPISSIPVSAIVFFILLGCTFAAAQASEGYGSREIPVWAVGKQSIVTGWGDNVFQAEYPVFTADSDGKENKMEEDESEKEEVLAGSKAAEKEARAYDEVQEEASPGNEAVQKKNQAYGGAGKEDISGNGNAAEEQAVEAGDTTWGKLPQSNGNDNKKPSRTDSNWKEETSGGDGNQDSSSSIDETIDINEPSLDSLMENVEDAGDLVAAELKNQIEDFINGMRSKFRWYISRKYNGHVGADIDYKILRNDADMLVLQFFCTINVGGSVEYSRSFVLDKKKGKILGLSDLFSRGSDYRSMISKEILRQMREQMKDGKTQYFVTGGIWNEKYCFKEIERDQDFYINGQNKLVIVFEEYEVAPGNMGRPEFVIDTSILKSILPQPSLLQ